jgi:hypothetical protein
MLKALETTPPGDGDTDEEPCVSEPLGPAKRRRALFPRDQATGPHACPQTVPAYLDSCRDGSGHASQANLAAVQAALRALHSAAPKGLAVALRTLAASRPKPSGLCEAHPQYAAWALAKHLETVVLATEDCDCAWCTQPPCQTAQR